MEKPTMLNAKHQNNNEDNLILSFLPLFVTHQRLNHRSRRPKCLQVSMRKFLMHFTMADGSSSEQNLHIFEVPLPDNSHQLNNFMSENKELITPEGIF